MKRKSRASENADESVELENSTDEATNASSAVEDNSNTSWKSKNKRRSGKFDEPTEDSSESVTEDNSKKSKGKRKSKSAVNSEDADEVDKKKSKRGSKKGKKNELETNGAGSDVEEQYEVQAVMDQKLVKGVKQFLIRWKGYGADSDTWEPESTLSCPELIAKFIASKEKKSKGRSPKKSKQDDSEDKGETSEEIEAIEEKKPKGRPSKKAKRNESDDDDDDDDGEPGEEYEVDRILDVYFKKNGKREFLVHWKGYTSTDNTWEPEENMQCIDLIKKFMDKVDKARESTSKELRVNRKPTNPFTLSMTQFGRRLSRRNQGKQRAHYAELE